MKFITSLKDLETYLGVSITKDILIKGISTDTRTIEKGDLFIAIKGDSFNGNQFTKDALQKGASAAIVDDKSFSQDKDKKIIYVKNSISALAKIAKNIINSYQGKVIAITGSNGKTSTTNILSKTLKKSSKTIGNYNNEIGMPLSVINASKKSKCLVLEIGASKFGDIDYLSKILRPHIGIITNIGHSHLEALKDIEGVLKVKSEMVQNIKSGGFLIVPNENKEHLAYWKKIRDDIKIITFGISKSADFYSTKVKLNPNGSDFFIESRYLNKKLHIKTPLEGEHNIRNILASCAAHYSLNENLDELVKKLNSNKLKGLRQIKSKWIKGSTLINDTYNANPDSTKKSIDLLSNYKKNTVLVLGDMLELGRYKNKLHKEIGKYAKAKGINKLLGYGDLIKQTTDIFGKNGIFFKKEDDLKAYLKENITSKDVILIKGSRGMKMERFIDV